LRPLLVRRSVASGMDCSACGQSKRAAVRGGFFPASLGAFPFLRGHAAARRRAAPAAFA